MKTMIIDGEEYTVLPRPNPLLWEPVIDIICDASNNSSEDTSKGIMNVELTINWKPRNMNHGK